MLAFPLREAMVGDQMHIEGGRLRRPAAPGIGVTLTPQIEAQYAYDEAAVYSCKGCDWGPRPDDYWK